MMQKIIGVLLIVCCCLGFYASISHLVYMKRIPKDKRIWWGADVALQTFYPVYVFGVLIGLYQFC